MNTNGPLALFAVPVKVPMKLWRFCPPDPSVSFSVLLLNVSPLDDPVPVGRIGARTPRLRCRRPIVPAHG